jgi:hypothetical protein
VRSVYLCNRSASSTPSATTDYLPIHAVDDASTGYTDPDQISVVVPAAMTIVRGACRSKATLASGESIQFDAWKSTDNGSTWATAGTIITRDSGDTANVTSTADVDISYAPGDMLAIRRVHTNGTGPTTNDGTTLALVIECEEGQILFGMAGTNSDRSATSDIMLNGTENSGSGQNFGMRFILTGRLRKFYLACDSGSGTWGLDLKSADVWASTNEVTVEADIVTGVSPGASVGSQGSNTALEYRIGPNELGKPYFFEVTNDTSGTSKLKASCVFVPDVPGASMGGTIRHTRSETTRYFFPHTCNAQQGSNESNNNCAWPADDFQLLHVGAARLTPPAGYASGATVRVDGVTIETVSLTEAAPQAYSFHARDDIDVTTDGDDYFNIGQAGTSDSGTDQRFTSWAFQDREPYETALAGTPPEYDELAVLPKHQPATTESDYTHFIDCSTLSLEHWANCDSTATAKFKVTDLAGTEIPCDVITFDKTKETGLLAVKDDLSASAQVGFRVYLPLSTRADRSAGNSGANAYDSSWDAFWPLDSTGDHAGSKTLTEVSMTAGTGTGFIGGVGASEFDGTADELTYSGMTSGASQPWLFLAFVKPDDTTGRGISTWKDGGTVDRQVWLDASALARARIYDTGSKNVTGTTNFTADEWAMVGGWCDGSAVRTVADGTLEGSTSSSYPIQYTTPVQHIGWVDSGGISVTNQFFDGTMQFVSVHTAARSEDWLAAYQANMFDPVGYYGRPTPAESEPTADDYCDATMDNPTVAIDEFVTAIDLSDMHASWWAAASVDDDSLFAHYMRAYNDDDGTITRAAIDVIEAVDSTAKTGIIRVRWFGSLPTAGTNKIRLYPPKDTYVFQPKDGPWGQWQTYPAAWKRYWPLTEDQYDRTSNQSHLTPTSIDTYGGGAGMLGGATVLDGANDYFKNAAPAGLDVPLSFVGCAYSTANDEVFMALYNGTTYDGFAIIGASGPKWRADHYGATTFGTAEGTRTENNWDHLVGVWTSNTSRSMYIDGTLAETDTTDTGTATPDTDLGVGIDPRYDTIPWAGRMQHLMLQTVALTADWAAAERKQLNDQNDFWNLGGLTWSWSGAAGPTSTFKGLTLLGVGG